MANAVKSKKLKHPLFILALSLFIIFTIFTAFYMLRNSQNKETALEGKRCGGIAANLPQNKCPDGYRCKLDGNYPDASGICVK